MGTPKRYKQLIRVKKAYGSLNEVRAVWWKTAPFTVKFDPIPEIAPLRVLSGEVVGEEMEVPWIVSQLLEGNNYGGLLLRLDPQSSSLSLLQGALLRASRKRMQVKVRPILWNAVEEAWAHTGLKTLHSGLLGNTLTDERLSQLGRALWELQVVKAWSQYPRSPVPKGARAEVKELPELKDCQAPDVALQLLLAQAQRRLQEQHQIWIQEELKHLGQEEVAGEQVKGPVAEEQRDRWLREQTVLRLQVEALQAERDTAEQDLAALYDLHVQATRAQTCHMLQVFAWQGLWEEKATTTEHQLRSLLAGVLQDAMDLALQNKELQAQNQQFQLQQGTSELGTLTLDPCPGEKPGDQEPFKDSYLPHSWES
ncbi:LOW QUALITY PROTEIN: uncharacterized protein O8D03_018947 [Erethizon dorsatum]